MEPNKTNVLKNIHCKWSYRAMIILLISPVIVQTSCKKLVEIDAPITSLTAKNVYTDNATATAVLTGIYASMGSGGTNYTGYNGLSLRTGLSGDELSLWAGGFDGGDNQQLYENNLLAQKPIGVGPWQVFYQQLLTINSAIEGLEASSSLTPAVKKQLLGEAMFMRAFFHFYLVNFYGDVPLALTSDWRINTVAHKTPKHQVYQQVIADLKEAQSLLNDNYLQNDALTPYKTGSEERVRPTKWAAAALLARVYLYTKDWANAEAQATLVINNNSRYSLSSLDVAFTKNNPEAIWQIQYVITDWGTEGYHFILTGEPGFAQPTFLSAFLLNAFEPGDNRKSNWIDSFNNGTDTWYFPNKYKAQSDPNNTEYFMVLRLAEQYLIRAEARAQQSNTNGAVADLNAIRLRAGITAYGGSTAQAPLLSAILHERQVELFTEWGHRWFDLKRTGTIDAVMTTVLPIKRPGFTWNTDWQLYPLSSNDIQINPNLAPNNPGY